MNKKYCSQYFGALFLFYHHAGLPNRHTTELMKAYCLRPIVQASMSY